MTKLASVPESNAREYLADWLSEWFHIREEVIGTGPLEKKARVDYWMYPQKETIKMGLPAEPIAVEAKGYGLQDHRKRTAIRLIYQAMLYSMCEFPMRSGPRKPGCVLIFPRLETILDIAGRTLEEQAVLRGVEYSLVRIGAMRGVGELEVRDGFCRIWFNGAQAWDSVRGLRGTGKIAGFEARERYSRS